MTSFMDEDQSGVAGTGAPAPSASQNVRQSRDWDESCTRQPDPAAPMPPSSTPSTTSSAAPGSLPSSVMNPSAFINPPRPGSSRTSPALSLATLTPPPIVEFQLPRPLPGDSRLSLPNGAYVASHGNAKLTAASNMNHTTDTRRGRSPSRALSCSMSRPPSVVIGPTRRACHSLGRAAQAFPEAS